MVPCTIIGQIAEILANKPCVIANLNPCVIANSNDDDCEDCCEWCLHDVLFHLHTSYDSWCWLINEFCINDSLVAHLIAAVYCPLCDELTVWITAA